MMLHFNVLLFNMLSKYSPSFIFHKQPSDKDANLQILQETTNGQI